MTSLPNHAHYRVAQHTGGGQQRVQVTNPSPIHPGLEWATKKLPLVSSSVIARLYHTPRTVFLIDGLGALLSALLLGLAIPRLESLVGMPSSVLYPLAGAACLLSFYSLSCARFLPLNWRRFLLIVAGANLVYCCITLALLVQHRDLLRPLGWLYFLGEIAIIVTLAALEITIAKRSEP